MPSPSLSNGYEGSDDSVSPSGYEARHDSYDAYDSGSGAGYDSVDAEYGSIVATSSLSNGYDSYDNGYDGYGDTSDPGYRSGDGGAVSTNPESGSGTRTGTGTGSSGVSVLSVPTPAPTTLPAADGAGGQLVIAEVAVDLAVFEESVGVDLRGNLSALSAVDEAAVCAFARDAAADLEAAVFDREDVDAQVTCLYRLEDLSRLDLLTLDQSCEVPRRAAAAQQLSEGGLGVEAARRLSEGGLGVILLLATPVEALDVATVEISSDGVTATATVRVLVVASSAPGKTKPAPPPEPPGPELTGGSAIAIAASGLLVGSVV